MIGSAIIDKYIGNVNLSLYQRKKRRIIPVNYVFRAVFGLFEKKINHKFNKFPTRMRKMNTFVEYLVLYIISFSTNVLKNFMKIH